MCCSDLVVIVSTCTSNGQMNVGVCQFQQTEACQRGEAERGWQGERRFCPFLDGDRGTQVQR